MNKITLNYLRKSKREMKVEKALTAVSGLVVVGGGLLTYAGRDIVDRFNPLVKEKDVYVLTKGEAQPHGA
ncbi:hypothetical protein ACWKTX_22965 [Bacillus thuringiensis]